MSSKFGVCPLCPPKSPAKRLYGGLCSYHLGNTADDHSKQTVEEVAKVLSRDKVLTQFYEDQWKIMTPRCENECGTRLIANTLRTAKFHICHIVPKKHFESVIVHPSNRWFGCWQCHHDYDSSWTKAVTMPIWPLVAERFTHFMHLIKDSELRHLPDCFRLLMDR